ncbi:MAG: GntP family permease [Bacteroidota bacterium]|nr:GntP family permease [Bacteroidota bacterium]
MNPSLARVIISMLAGIMLIIILTTRWRLAVFFSMLIACLATGMGVSMPLPEIISTAKTGFGNIMQSLGFIIVLGTTLGVFLEHTGCAKVMANYILEKTGKKNASLAIGITGFIVGLPVFCDSGYIVLNGINKSLIRKTGLPVITMSVSLAAGLYAVHCLLPPHPGAASAAGTIGVDFGKLLLYGIIVAVPVMLAGYWWAVYAGKKIPAPTINDDEIPEDQSLQPPVLKAFLPVIIPIILIAAKSLLSNIVPTGKWSGNLLAIGDPVIALSIAVLLAVNAKRDWNKNTLSVLLHEALEKAGTILLIIGAGGAFGAILAATNIGNHLGKLSSLNTLGLLFPFLLTFILKTAQGSSTVAIITAASIVLPLLTALGLDSSNGRLLTVLAMGAGSMMISHANDAYFWVIARFSGIDMKTMLKAYSVATIIMGITAIAIVCLLSTILL